MCRVLTRIFLGTVGTVGIVLIAVRVAFQSPELSGAKDASVRLGDDGWRAFVHQNLQEIGYAHMVNLLNRSEVEQLRSLAHEFCYSQERRALPLTWGGYSVPNFLGVPHFEGARWLVDDPRLHDVLGAAFQDSPFRFASHNDVGCDFVGVWHKDVLRGPQKKYQELDIWSSDPEGEKHEIYKVMVYLQDHDQDDRALKVVPGSHLSRNISLDGGYVALRPRMGDVVIFDQRLSHAGNTIYDPFSPGRLFIQVGFGKVNKFTDEFERGTVERQDGYQAKMLLSSQPRGWKTVLTDAKFAGIGLLFSALPPQLLNSLADIDVKKHAMLGKLIFGNNAGPPK